MVLRVLALLGMPVFLMIFELPRSVWRSEARKAIIKPTPKTIFSAPGQAFAALSIASRMRRGVYGVSLNSAPVTAKASRSALPIAAGGAMVPPSPMPLRPYRVNLAGVTMWPILMSGT